MVINFKKYRKNFIFLKEVFRNVTIYVTNVSYTSVVNNKTTYKTKK